METSSPVSLEQYTVWVQEWLLGHSEYKFSSAETKFIKVCYERGIEQAECANKIMAAWR